MVIQIDREKKLTLLRWLKQGYIDTLDMPGVYNGSSLFLDFLMETEIKEDEPPEKAE